MHTQDTIVCDTCKSTFKQVRHYLSHVFSCSPTNIIAPTRSPHTKTMRVKYDARLIPGAKIHASIRGDVQSIEEVENDFFLVTIRVAENTFRFV